MLKFAVGVLVDRHVPPSGAILQHNMGKKERAEAAHKHKEQKKLEQKTGAAQNDTTLPVLAVMVVVSIGLVMFSNVVFQSETEGRAHVAAAAAAAAAVDAGA